MSSSTSLLDQAAALARLDPRSVDGDELMVMGLDAVRAVSLLEAHVARVGAELEARGTTDAVHGLRTGSWLAREAPTSPAAMRLRIRAGQTLTRHWPLVLDALLAGDVSWEHVRALLAASNPRVVEAIGGIQEPIIEMARGCGFEQWKADVASLIRLLDQDGPDPEPGDGANRLSWKTTLDGVLDVQATLQHDLGLVLRTAVDRRADELFREYTRDHEQCPDIVVPSRAELCAMALIDLIRRGVGAEPGDGRARVEVTLIHHTDRDGTCEHDGDCSHGATEAARDIDDDDDGDEGGAEATGDPGGFDPREAAAQNGTTKGKRNTPDETISRNGDRPGRDPSARSAWPGLTDLGGHPIHGEQAGVWSCVAERSVLTVDRNGVPLNLGRSRRLASPGQRKALAVRDGGCTFPGCEHPAMWTDAHHVTAWEHGGCTDLDQLVSLCRRHHGVAHRAGWVLTLGDDGWTRWTTPSGVTVIGQRHHRRPHEPAADNDDNESIEIAHARDGPHRRHARDGPTAGRSRPRALADGLGPPPGADVDGDRWADTG